MIDRLTLLQKIGVYFATFVFLLFILMPFIEMIRVSLRPMSHLMTADFTWWSEDFSLQAYRDMWNTVPLLGRYIFNSIFIASAGDRRHDDRRHPRRLRLCAAGVPVQGPVAGGLPGREHVHRRGPSDPALPRAALALGCSTPTGR
jgi:hypothetical protein